MPPSDHIACRLIETLLVILGMYSIIHSDASGARLSVLLRSTCLAGVPVRMCGSKWFLILSSVVYFVLGYMYIYMSFIVVYLVGRPAGGALPFPFFAGGGFFGGVLVLSSPSLLLSLLESVMFTATSGVGSLLRFRIFLMPWPDGPAF